MTTAEAPARTVGAATFADRRGSWVPNWSMVTTRAMELRKRRGMMAALIAVNVGIPAVLLGVRLIAHAVDPKAYGPAGGYDIFTHLSAGILFVFGFIVAAVVGCTAGSVDLTEGMFRHLVVTGRSRLAIYFARIPAGLAIVLPIVTAGFAIVCLVCSFAAPTRVNYDGVSLRQGLSLAQFDRYASNHAATVLCDFPYSAPVPVFVACGPNGPIAKSGLPPDVRPPSPAAIRAAAVAVATADYRDYRGLFLKPSGTLMFETWLWILLEATLGFIVGLGLASLIGQRTLAVVLMIVLEVILTPLLTNSAIAHLVNLQRAIVGLAMGHIEPVGLPLPFNNGDVTHRLLVPESTTVAVLVIVAWLVGWTAIGAWRMATRDA